MKKILLRVGVALRVAGILLSVIAGVAHFSPPNDPTEVGSLYDERVEAYNQQLKQFADANPKLPAPAPANEKLPAGEKIWRESG